MIGYFLLTIMTVTTRPSTQPLTYGSDINGVVCAYWFDGTGANQPIEADQLNERLRAENLKQGFVWLHMDLNVSHAESWLKQHLSLEDEFFDSLHQGLSSTKIDQADQQLLAVMNDVRYDFNFDPSEISTLWLVADQHFMVTGRRTHLSSIDRLRRAVKRNDPFESSTDLLTHLLQDQAEVLANIIRKVTRQVDEIEDAILSSHLGQHRAKLGQLRRVMVRLARLLAPEPPLVPTAPASTGMDHPRSDQWPARIHRGVQRRASRYVLTARAHQITARGNRRTNRRSEQQQHFHFDHCVGAGVADQPDRRSDGDERGGGSVGQ